MTRLQKIIPVLAFLFLSSCATPYALREQILLPYKSGETIIPESQHELIDYKSKMSFRLPSLAEPVLVKEDQGVSLYTLQMGKNLEISCALGVDSPMKYLDQLTKAEGSPYWPTFFFDSHVKKVNNAAVLYLRVTGVEKLGENTVSSFLQFAVIDYALGKLVCYRNANDVFHNTFEKIIALAAESREGLKGSDSIKYATVLGKKVSHDNVFSGYHINTLTDEGLTLESSLSMTVKRSIVVGGKDIRKKFSSQLTPLPKNGDSLRKAKLEVTNIAGDMIQSWTFSEAGEKSIFYTDHTQGVKKQIPCNHPIGIPDLSKILTYAKSEFYYSIVDTNGNCADIQFKKKGNLVIEYGNGEKMMTWEMRGPHIRRGYLACCSSTTFIKM